MRDSVRQLNYVVLLCHDLPATKRFYRDVVKLSLRLETPDWTEFGTSSTLLALRPRTRPYDGVRSEVASAGVQLAFRVPPGAVDSCHGELVASGVEILEPPSEQPFGHRTLFFRDPEGNVVEIYTELSQAAGT